MNPKGNYCVGLVVILFVLLFGRAPGAKVCSDYLSGCDICNSTTLECKGTFDDSVDVFKKLPKDLEWISVTGNNFSDKIPINIFGDCSHGKMNKLDYLDLSNNYITALHGKTFHCMPNVETLILSHNEWHVNNHTHVFASLTSLKRLILQNTFFEKFNGTSHLAKLALYMGVTGMHMLEELNLSGNEVWNMPTQTHNALCALEKIEKLDLSDNKLQDVTLCSDLANLKVLNLSNNNLARLSPEMTKNISRLPKLETLYLEDNLFQCDCGMVPFYHWLRNESMSRAVHNRRGLKCWTAYDTVNDGRAIVDLTLDDLVCRREKSYNATGVVVGLLFTVIVVMFVIAMYYNRVLLRQTWKRCVGKPVTLSLIPQSQGYATVEDHMGQM